MPGEARLTSASMARRVYLAMLEEVARESDVPRGTIYFWPDGVVFVGVNIANEPHRHFTASLAFSLDGKFRARAAGRDWAPHAGMLVAPNVEQQMDARGTLLVIMQIDPETSHFARIAHRFDEDGPYIALDEELVEQLSSETDAAARQGDALRLWRIAISRLARPGVEGRVLDERIVHAMAVLKASFFAPPTASALAAQVGLSEGRLIHLFSEQMGLPIRRYILWLRMRDVIYSIALGKTMTEAAHAAGFSDSAHMTRTFRNMFGLRPSLLFKQQKNVRLELVLDDVFGSSGPHAEYDRARWGSEERLLTRLARR